MQLVPIIPQLKISVEESLEVARIAAVKASRPVAERTLPPLLSYAHERSTKTSVETTQQKTHQLDRQEDRRSICRRLQHQTILEELRSSIDRRRHQHRKTDMRLHIDEEV